jgi:hypothetical protein
MNRPDCRQIFIVKTLDLINGAFSRNNLYRVLDRMHAQRLNEQMHMYGKNLFADWVMFDQLEGRIMDIKGYCLARAENILEKYMDYFNLSGTYKLTVVPALDCKVKINSWVAGDVFEGTYYLDYPTVIIPVLPEGKEFDCWIVNGNEVKDEVLYIVPELLSGNEAEVTCITK